jgi:hypothetical protein
MVRPLYNASLRAVITFEKTCVNDIWLLPFSTINSLPRSFAVKIETSSILVANKSLFPS